MAAETDWENIPFVEDIYGVLDATRWNDNQRKKFRDDRLDDNADVLFRVYKPVHPPDIQKLHCLLLTPTRDPIWWMMFIRRHYVLTVQWTHRVEEEEEEEGGLCFFIVFTYFTQQLLVIV
ncbi:hypothetical protein DPX16_1302 [Anabarilius grahami]|uniref:Uncharacterized protein n=1 Tax=Anabarilius grahami TaxID=495550 RepID=A0A3N0Y7I8_ANAGA|nr:hypothetical protein DPX16_1302 [Anabarilius grahami]